jgi:hypothetical protein
MDRALHTTHMGGCTELRCALVLGDAKLIFSLAPGPGTRRVSEDAA